MGLRTPPGSRIPVPGLPGPLPGPQRALPAPRGGWFYINPSRRGPVPGRGTPPGLPGVSPPQEEGSVGGAPAPYRGGGTPRRAAGGFARRAVRYEWQYASPVVVNILVIMI